MWIFVANWPVAPALLLLLALALDAVAGDFRPVFRLVPHPVALVGRLIAVLDRKLNRADRSEVTRRLRGLLVALSIAALAFAAGWIVHRVAAGYAAGWIVELLLVAILVAQRSLRDHVAAVDRALESDGLAAGRRAVAHIVGRDPESLDEYAVRRAAVESLFENFADGVVAPVFWYALLGLPGLCALKAINTLDSMIGHRSERYRAFGEAAARLDTAVMLIPARLAGAIVALAAASVPGGNPFAGLRMMWRDAAKHRSMNAGWPEAAAAGALGLALAGPRRYGATMVDDPWIGDGRARLTHDDVARALRLFAIACLLHAALAAFYLLLRHG
jgi:adenosylcobinamide-phosphate synthase